jgi:hypothetical protein
MGAREAGLGAVEKGIQNRPHIRLIFAPEFGQVDLIERTLFLEVNVPEFADDRPLDR